MAEKEAALPKVAGVQMDVAFGQKGETLRRMEHNLETTAVRGAALTAFPECALTGYGFKSLDKALPHAEPVPGPATETTARIRRRLGLHAVFGLLESEGERIFNYVFVV